MKLEAAEAEAMASPPGIEQAYRGFGARLYHYLLGMVHSASDAEDAVQTIFVKLAGRHGDPIEDLTTYLFVAARNEASRILEQRARRRRDELEEAPPFLEAPPGLEDEKRRVEDALRLLPHDQREVVLLKIYEGLKFREIAAVLGVPQDTAASRYRYAMEKLRDQLGME